MRGVSSKLASKPWRHVDKRAHQTPLKAPHPQNALFYNGFLHAQRGDVTVMLGARRPQGGVREGSGRGQGGVEEGAGHQLSSIFAPWGKTISKDYKVNNP